MSSIEKLLAERSTRFKFLSETVLRLGRPLLVGWEDGGTEDWEEEDWDEEVVSWVPAPSYAEITEPLFLLFFLFVAWPKVALVSRLCAWG
jgi:hypothetical protein